LKGTGGEVADIVWQLSDWLEGKANGAVSGDLAAPLVKAGNATFTIEGGNALTVTAKENGWNGIDVRLTAAERGLDLDIANNVYTITVTGSLIGTPEGGSDSVGLKRADDDWGNVADGKAQSGALTAADAAFTLEFEFPADYFTTPKPQTKIRINAGKAGTNFKITEIVVEKVRER